MNYCTNCSTAIEPGQLFCRNCGARVQLTSISKSPSLADKTQGALRRAQEALSDTKDKSASRAREIGSGFTRLLQSIIQIGPKAVSLVKENPIRWGGIFLGGILMTAYAISFSIILNSSGPEGQIQKYLSAVNSKDVASLSDANLFPDTTGYPIMPKELTALYGNDTLQSEGVSWSWFADDASLRLANTNGEDVSVLQLKATGHWNLGFYTKSWEIVSPAPTFRLSAITLGSTQTGTFGSLSVKGSSDPSFTKYIGKTFIGFPGLVQVSTDEFGFESAAENSVSVGSGETAVIRANEGDLSFPSYLETSAGSRADSTASYCASNNCDLLPYFSDSDYSWDTDPAWDTYYDYSDRASSYSSNGCDLVDSVAQTATTGYADFDCGISSSRAIAHVITYYFLPDDVSYFNGTASQTMSLTVHYRYSPSSDQFMVTSVTN